MICSSTVPDWLKKVSGTLWHHKADCDDVPAVLRGEELAGRCPGRYAGAISTLLRVGSVQHRDYSVDFLYQHCILDGPRFAGRCIVCRHARLVTLSFSVSWILAVVMSFGLLFWLILFAYQLERSEQTGTVRRSDALPAGRPAQRHGVFVYPANAVGP